MTGVRTCALPITSRAGRSDMGGARAADRLLGMEISPLNRRRLQNFRANARGFWSLWIFLALFVLTLFAEFIATDRTFLVYYDGAFYVPVLAIGSASCRRGDCQ